jgi:hypothetical protein
MRISLVLSSVGIEFKMPDPGSRTLQQKIKVA